MQLSDIRQEVLNKGFNPTLFGTSRINNFINDGYMEVCRRVDYYVDEASQTYQTTTGQTDLSLPSNWARSRSLLDTDLGRELVAVGLRDIDRAVVTQGTPAFYATDGQQIRIYPTADGTHNLLFRYYQLPALLVNDTDVPTLPLSYHKLLWLYATWQGYESEDDPQMGQYWQTRFMTELQKFEADVRFPNTDYGTQVKSMWGDEQLGVGGWRRWPEGF